MVYKMIPGELVMGESNGYKRYLENLYWEVAALDRSFAAATA